MQKQPDRLLWDAWSWVPPKLAYAERCFPQGGLPVHFINSHSLIYLNSIKHHLPSIQLRASCFKLQAQLNILLNHQIINDKSLAF